MLARLEDGQPLLVERPVGAGSVLLLGTALHVDWTNLPLKPLFLPLLTRLTFHLAGADAERTMGLAGAPVACRRARAGPGPARSSPSRSRSFALPARWCACREPRTNPPAPSATPIRTRPESTWCRHGRSATSTRQLAFAVNIDPAEVRSDHDHSPGAASSLRPAAPALLRKPRGSCRHDPTPARRDEPVGVVPVGRVDRAGARGFSGQPWQRDGTATTPGQCTCQVRDRLPNKSQPRLRRKTRFAASSNIWKRTRREITGVSECASNTTEPSEMASSSAYFGLPEVPRLAVPSPSVPGSP